MRVFALLSLVLALVIVGLLAKKQLATAAAPVLPSVPGVAAPALGDAPVNARTQAEQVQKQVKEALDAAAQARKMPDDN
ncbi:hypothetical protein [Variovorax paradoxus]|jgi:hypothetical protein|uniref:hypothetical protein n=1 Tax=Variovorax paradoxus TaxID=34073 RepID=UPI002780EDBD|nr:hypothetical protein [Variovorax paradoxus]MDP9931180.1 hypothetical protein [Variovorax paradoxus]